MPAVFTVFNRPRGYDQTQRRFSLSGNMAITGTYTNGTGIVPSLNTGILQMDGSAYTLPPTYTGSNGPGQGVPTGATVQDIGGYTILFTGGTLRIYNGITELTTGTVPAAISAAGVPTTVTYLRG